VSLLERVLRSRRLVLTGALLLSVSGAAAWLTMVRQEDPRLPDFWGQVVAPYPGADAETVERLVLSPIEDSLAQVSQIKEITATAYDEVAVILIELRGDVSDYREAWDDVREALDEARLDFPDGVGEARLDEDQQDQDSVVLAITGAPDPLRLLAGARRLRDELLVLPLVARVSLVASPGEQATIELDDAAARRLGQSAGQLAAQLAARDRVIPGGSLRLGGKTVRLRPHSEFASVDEMAATPVTLRSGSAVPLRELARVHLGPEEPVASLMRIDGEMAVGLAIVPRRAVNLVDFGNEVRERVARVAERLQPLQVREVMFQPLRVKTRISQLGRSLLLSILVVAGVLFLAMGTRLGLVVVAIVPLVAMSSLAVYAWGGGVLHQISIAALVLALGMLVDNAIVIAEAVQWELDRGRPAKAAALQAVRDLAIPLAGATGTTVAAFVPMLIAEGPTAVFTRAIPVVIMLTLSVSYLYAVLVTPILSEMILRPRETRGGSFSGRIGQLFAHLAIRRPARVLAIAGLLVLASLVLARSVPQQFFPSSDRNQMVIDLKLPEGTHLDTTDAASRELERALLGRPEVAAVASFIGRSAPKFYYNILPVPWSPHFAQLVVDTQREDQVDGVLSWLRGFARSHLTEAEVVARKLEQGPPVRAPVELRIYGRDLQDLTTTAQRVAEEVKAVPGTIDVRHDVGPGAPVLRFLVDDAAAARFSLSRADVALALYGRTRGLPVGELRTGDDPIPVVVRSAAGERMPAEDLQSVDVAAPDGRAIPLGQLARLETEWRPAAIDHHNTRRVVRVLAQLEPGAAFSDVMSNLRPRLRALTLPADVEIGFGGDAEGSEEANSAMLVTLPIGLLLLFGVLLAEFNSFRRLFIILVTVPLAATGVVPGLLIGDQPFGFMSLLGVFALVGIVVNNAIVLLEVVESRREEGATIDEALKDAVARRIRPIFLTTATTVAGLVPLAFSQSTLWPPLAWAIISGLTASSLLTLLVVPALYRLLFARSWAAPTPGPAAQVATLVAALLLVGTWAGAEPLDLDLTDSMRQGRERPAAVAAEEGARAAQGAATAERRSAFLPVVGASFEATDRNRELALITPIGEFPFGSSRVNRAGLQITQPLLDVSRMVFASPAARAEAESVRLGSERARDQLAAQAGLAHAELLQIGAQQETTRAYVTSLRARLLEVEAMASGGRALGADVLKVRLALERAELEELTLREAHAVSETALAHAVGHDGEVRAHPVPDWSGEAAPPFAAALERALGSRADLAARDSTSQALTKRRHAVRAEWLPRAEGYVAWTWTDGSPYSVTNWVEGGVRVTWAPFVAATRGARSAALEAQRNKTLAEIQEARRGVELEVRGALMAIETARAAVGVGERAVEQAGETLRVERERHLEGRATTNDLLEAEAALREQRTHLEIARLDVTRAWIRLWLSGGGELPPRRPE